MCGIAGIFSNATPGDKILQQAQLISSVLKHRGPDDEGFTCFDNNHESFPFFGPDTPEEIKESIKSSLQFRDLTGDDKGLKSILIHRRLSIIDLSAMGHQPMSDLENRYHICFNGEIYNYKDLKRELHSLGFHFRSESDTEVLLYAYIHWGKDVIHRLNGMWAFAIYDRDTYNLFLCRDRLGVKPLYYYHHSGSFVFASEQKAIWAAKPECKKINHEAVFDFFTVGRIESGQENFFSHIQELAPGHYLQYNTRQEKIINIQQWFEPDMLKSNIKPIELSEQVFDAVNQAVKLRLQADVEVATCLSGGLDSSSILMMMHHLQDKKSNNIKAFTASFDGSEIDETRHAEIIVKASNAQWYTVSPDANSLIEDFESLTWCQDIPLWSTSTYAQFKVMEKVKKCGVKVVLDGQGGDELFAGYQSHRLTYALELMKGFHLLASQQIYSLLSGEMIRFVLKNFMERNSHPSLRLWFYKNFSKGTNFLKNDFLQANKHRFEMLTSLPIENLRKRLDAEQFNHNLKSYLITEDRCSMWHSVESRTPFADDPDLMALTRNIPSERLIDGTYGKKILREAMQKILPQEICWRRDKLGFQTPNNQWLREIADQMKPLILEYLPAEIFDLEKISAEYDTYFKPKHNHDDASVFKFHSFAMWMKMFEMKV
ncbi:MAG: asparagine synthase (glutamine-hydrolyzing) [Flavobacteriales bacterium]